jgi:hypothetical protein
LAIVQHNEQVRSAIFSTGSILFRAVTRRQLARRPSTPKGRITQEFGVVCDKLLKVQKLDVYNPERKNLYRPRGLQVIAGRLFQKIV